MSYKYLFVISIIALLTCESILTVQASDVLSDIERMASLGERFGQSAELLVEEIEANATVVTAELIPKLNDQSLTDNQLSTYVWALGLTKEKEAFTPIKELHARSRSELVLNSCLRAVAMIPGRESGEFLLNALTTSSDKTMRYNILDLLGQIQCEAALPHMEEILKQDPKELYWQANFIFGKMGEKSVPFLLQRIDDADLNTRVNSIRVLGQWLISPEAAKPIQAQFWNEKNVELRLLILSSLERIICDLSQMKAFFEEVVAKEKDQQAAKFANEALANMDKWRAMLASFAQKKKVSAITFDQEYAILFKSAGKKGNYELLSISSTIGDGPKLKSLRERILQRNSDEAFYDYQKVNRIIMLNRLLHSF